MRPSTVRERRWVTAVLRRSVAVARSSGLDPSGSRIGVGVGEPVTRQRVLATGYRGPKGAEGASVLSLLSACVWGVPGACGPWALPREARTFEEFTVNAMLGPPPGTVLLYDWHSPEADRLLVVGTLRLPGLHAWTSCRETLRLDDESTLAAVEAYGTFVRDGMNADEALAAGVRLAL